MYALEPRTMRLPFLTGRINKTLNLKYDKVTGR
jgi:hypothetical protein